LLVSAVLTVAGLQLVDCCLACCYHGNTVIVAMAAEIYVGIISLKWKGKTNCTLVISRSAKNSNWARLKVIKRVRWLYARLGEWGWGKRCVFFKL